MIQPLREREHGDRSEKQGEPSRPTLAIRMALVDPQRRDWTGRIADNQFIRAAFRQARILGRFGRAEAKPSEIGTGSLQDL